MAAKSPPSQVTLQCGHDATYLAPQPAAGDTVYCRRCQHYVTVRANEDEAWARCTQCRVAKKHGQDFAAAMRTASKHAMTKHHIVNVLRGREILQTVDPTGKQGEMPFDRIIGDRRALSAELQKMLRPD